MKLQRKLQRGHLATLVGSCPLHVLLSFGMFLFRFYIKLILMSNNRIIFSLLSVPELYITLSTRPKYKISATVA